MPTTVTMPALSPTMKEGVIAKWIKKEGDRVESGDTLCEITTDKSTVEFESIEEGFLRKIVVAEGGKALINQGIAILAATKEEDISGYKLEEPNLIREEKPIEVATPHGGEEPRKVVAQAAPLGMAFQPSPPKEGYKFPEKGERVLASPLAKRIALENNLDLSSVRGSGPHGRVVAKDLDGAKKLTAFTVPEGEMPSLPPGTYEEETLSPIRKVIGERLQASKMTIPHYYVRHEIRADRMKDLREQLKETGVNVTFNDFVLRGAALALRAHPVINSGYDSVNQKIIRFQTVDISLAVSIPSGLITPILFHADYKNITTLSYEAKQLAKRAKENSLKPEEYQGGSFTVSNLGMYGITTFDAVINPPQAAILAVGGIHEKLFLENGAVKQGYVMHVTLSSDHRVIDGKDAAEFLVTLKKLLENPAILLT